MTGNPSYSWEMDPVEALDRALYFLDRDNAPREKKNAFRAARARVVEVGLDETVDRVHAGTITQLADIGKSTGEVISDAVKGVDDGYLARLDTDSQVPLGPGGDLRALLRGDCHSHSTWSDGGGPLTEMALTAKRLGHDYLVATDHSARLTIAHGLNEERLRSQWDELVTLNAELRPFRILSGMEVDIFEDGSLDLSDTMLAELDIVVASAHSKLDLEPELMTRRLVTAVANPHVDILGHMTNRKLSGAGRPPSRFDAEVVLAACARFGTAVEINCRPDRQDPPEELLELAVEWDCYVSVNTDAHAAGQLEWQAFGCDKAVRCGVDPDRIINTWPVERLLEWAAVG